MLASAGNDLFDELRSLGLQMYAAADPHPEATPAALQAIASKAPGVFALIAHGGTGGIAIGPAGAQGTGTPWPGSGVSFERVGFLMLVSCAVGRLEGGAGRDVDGLVVRLAAAGAPQTLAAKWDINGPQAVEVAAAAARAFAGSQRGNPHRRAEALAAAREEFAGRPGYLNTLAAFDVYGPPGD